jgi:hypothetical protein
MTKKIPAHRGNGGGAEQMKQLDRLYSQSTAPAPAAHPDAPYYPQRLGEIIAVSGLPGRFEVTGLDDPSLVTVRTPNGATMRVGWRMVRRAES